MAEAKVVLINPLGLHARAAAKIVKIANTAGSRIVVERPSRDRSADARSLLGLLELGAKNGSTLVLRVTGDDAEEVLSNLVQLIDNGFGEI